ncbi:hypothetical protein BC939DRAFT_506743 [Gamsiella multidivaricata]|uniref:uncharacterized protein n=1 Tax=Gamsiella multidivaricata TaxID=101098 RepID=UPI0022203F56|nr:uncharacterized protein BC939DRAFT_506743 [Gamsiella multidivaricata]KAG0370396.1 hypothetical protein BGZ54_006516 [Gamsiella multidivaricata]KAI7818238.1 hypothetical protein BC939DRAFT_506743 [Gamsiella multidivaricata]
MTPTLDPESDPALTQTIAHKIGDEWVTFDVPVSTVSSTGETIVMLQPILDIFPETVALCRTDRTSVPFMTNSDDVLMVPMRVLYIEDEVLLVVPAHASITSQQFQTRTSSPSPILPESTLPSLSHSHTPWPVNNPFDAAADTHSPRSESSLSFTSALSDTGLDHNVFELQSLAGTLSDSTHTPASNFSLSTLLHLGAAIFAQSVPLSEQPVPRLFIILPDAKPRHWDETSLVSATAPTSSHPDVRERDPRTFRLYFLCDCSEGATFPLHIEPNTTEHGNDNGNGNGEEKIDLRNCSHIADQPGYEILNMKQFCEQFGTYTLLLLRVLKHGIYSVEKRGCISQPKVTVPPLSQRQYTDVLQPFTWEIEERVSTAIETLERILAFEKKLEGMDEATPPAIDLRRLWECVERLRVGGEMWVESMRRVSAHDETTRWICHGHYLSTFDHLREDRKLLIRRCREILGNEHGNGISEQLDNNCADNNSTCGSKDKAVILDDRKKHLRLTSELTSAHAKQLELLLGNDYTVQEMSLVTSLLNKDLLSVITDMILGSNIELWHLSLVPRQASTIIPGGASSAPALHLYSHTRGEANASYESMTMSGSQPDVNLDCHAEYLNGNLHSICSLLVLDRIQSLDIPDFGHGLFTSLDPSAGEFPYLRKLRLWGSDPTGTRDADRAERSLASPWNTSGLGSLLKAFTNLTELCLSGIFLGDSLTSAKNDHSHPLTEVTQSLFFLPYLSVLELSSCGLLQKHCAELARSLALLDNRITHLDIHNNWIEDEGLGELLWSVGQHLFALDARNTGFGGVSAFALASMLESHEHEVMQNQISGHASRKAIYRILKLEEITNPHSQLWPMDPALRSLIPRTPDLDINGRQHLVRALKLLEPKELCIRIGLGFQDEDFASAFAGMKSLDCLERLQVSNSNFGPLAAAAMLKVFRATSCRISELDIQSTLLSERAREEILDQILSF